MTARALLGWYDASARAFPWRTPPGGGPADPYRVWLSEIMLQQTLAATVIPYFTRFTARWPDIRALAAAPRDAVLAEWAGLGYYARARNLHKCALVVTNEHDGRFPDTVDGLLSLPGVGPYTAGAIAAIAFDRRVAAVDGNVERVMSRFRAIEAPLPAAKAAIRAATETLVPMARPGDFAQALMDLGATICTPRNPSCGACPIADGCAALAAGLVPVLPRRAPRPAKPERRGVVYVHFREDGAVLVETRPDRGLLGGMTGLPGPEWTKAPPTAAAIAAAAPAAADWRDAGAEAVHIFTHFTLRLRVLTATGPGSPGARYEPIASARAALPTAFRKALDIARGAVAEGRPETGGPSPN